MARFASTPQPPYYAVIFTMQRTSDDTGYRETAAAMFALASKQPGCLGVETATDAGGFGMTIAYFTDDASIRAWNNNADHRAAQKQGQERWYSHYEMRVARVERAYSGPPPTQ